LKPIKKIELMKVIEHFNANKLTNLLNVAELQQMMQQSNI
jgi:hypothetical protein